MVENKDVEKQETCGKCLRLVKIPGHTCKGYCRLLDCLVGLDDTLMSKRILSVLLVKCFRAYR